MFINYLFTDPVYFFRIVAILIISIVLHELAHGWAALSQGDDTPVITEHMTPNPMVHLGGTSLILLCLAGIAWGKMPVNPNNFRNPKWGSILVSAAGPLMNLFLASGAMLMINVVSGTSLREVISIQFFLYMALLNLVLFMFNLLPIPPLDGFHVLSELIPSLKPLVNSPFGLAAFMILFISNAFESLFGFASTIMTFVVGL